MTNTIIRASAGSGKTYQLSNRFLQQIFDAPTVETALDSTLASTFTRKAAGEITDRIFTKFADLALDETARDSLRQDLRFPNSAADIQKCLADLAKNMFRMRVGTLDSYFNRIASAFALELGLPPGWAILGDSDHKRLLVEAVREVFEESDQNGAKKLMHLLQKGESKAAIIDDLVELAANVLPCVRATQEEAWEHDVPGRLRECTAGMLDHDRLADAVAQLETVDLPPHQSFRSQYAKLCRLVADVKSVDAVDWKKVLGHGLVKKIIADDDVYYRHPIEDDLKEAVRPLIRHATAVEVKALVHRTKATYDLLRLVAGKLDELMVRERKFRFEDITRKVAGYEFGDERLPALNHRLNGETRHLLLDEFQDTSMAQWSVLRPLAEKIAQDEHGTFFCVGDVKQSIYSWRGGVAAIFDTMKKSIEASHVVVKEESMDATRRCRPQIVATVNTLFRSIQGNAAVATASPKAGVEWQKRFHRHEPHIQDEDGYAVLEESPRAEEDESKKDVHLHYVVHRIVELADILEERPQLKHGLGVLVSTGAMGAALVAELKRRGIEVNGGGGLLADSAAVRYVLSAMTLADHPGDTIARFHLANGPLKEVLGLKDDRNPETSDRNPETSDRNPEASDRNPETGDDADCSRNIRRDLATYGYGETVRKYAEVLAPFCDPHEFLRLEKLLELAYRFDAEATGIRTEAFTEMIQSAHVGSPDAANITVATIHSAKGLEYDIVVLPQLDFDFSGTTHTPEFVVDHACPDDKTTPMDFVLRYANADIQSILPNRYQQVFARRIQGEVEESLSELYVAMTRAIYQLVMIVAPKSNDSVGKTFGDALRCGLPREKQSQRENVLFDLGHEKWFETRKRQVGTQGKSEPMELVCVIPERKVCHHVSRIAPSSLHQEVEKAADDKTYGRGPVWGTAMHACFEHGVLWLDALRRDEPNASDDAFLQGVVAKVIRGETVSFTPEEVVAQFRQSCKIPEIAAALSRNRYAAPHVSVERERKFTVWIGDKIMRGSVDRLVVGRDHTGRVTEIEILDYKSDVADDVQPLVAAYREQLEAYRKGVAELYKIDLEKIKATLVFVTLGKIASL